MNKIIFDDINKVQWLFKLLNLSSQHQDLSDARDNLLNIYDEKKIQLKRKNFDLAAQLRQKEIEAIEKIINLLNKKQILVNGVLTIEILPHQPL